MTLEHEPITAAHGPELRELLADPRVAPWLAFGADTDFDRMARRHARHWDEHGFGYWLFREDGRLVGRGGLQRTLVEKDEEVEVGWAVRADLWGRGHATEIGRIALAHAARLGLGPVVAFTLPDNLASRRVMEKLGMTYERSFERAGLPHVLYKQGAVS